MHNKCRYAFRLKSNPKIISKLYSKLGTCTNQLVYWHGKELDKWEIVTFELVEVAVISA